VKAGVNAKEWKTARTRRQFLQRSALAAGSLLIGFEKLEALKPRTIGHSPLSPEDKQLGIVEFVGESSAPLDTIMGAGLDARLYSDLATLGPEDPLLPTEKFYLRTRASELLGSETPWKIKVRGLVDRPTDLSLANLRALARPMGLHLMECAGNARATRFGLLSVADWGGAPVGEVLDGVRTKSAIQRVMISGFDTYPEKAVTSLPGADWVFTREELESAKAFLATEMNQKPLLRDHGAPVRLVVPGWYGCACIKWVNAITLVDDGAVATSQMQEFAGRTHQTGMPALARDYRPAKIEQAAMPIRVERWLVNGKIKYRVIGILWGGMSLVRTLEIRFNPEEEYVQVDSFTQKVNDPWSFWSHEWAPKARGRYTIRLRVKDPSMSTRRLDSGYYARTVEIEEASE
jgi:DMSO/TMAO reductase YedYZ molybdopterin-dependent catalytic subunit